jgi:putative ubiquitin-RnfH superfamily antitoxin RatB of RatAB toxin-antitoxin module
MANAAKEDGTNRFRVEVAYARPDVQVVLPVEVGEGATLRDAIEKSGVLEKFPELDIDQMDVGIFGKLSKLANPLRPRDRVEIYRPLIADPKEVRKRRAAEGKRMKKGGGEEEGKPDSGGESDS